MEKVAPPAPAAARPLWVVVLSAGLIVGIAMGIRQVMGLYLPPMTRDLGIGREPFSTAMAVANLVWGFGAVFAGMVADRYGAGRVIVGGTLATMAGFYWMYAATSGFDLLVSGVLLGIGVSGTGITALVGAAGRAAPPDKRTAAIASLGMASGIGGFVAFPYTHFLMDAFGWQASLMLLLVTSAVVVPLALPLSGKPSPTAGLVDDLTLVEAFKEAFTHPSYLLLVTGFFVCGFHVAFYGVHLPAFAADKGLDASVAVTALTMVGLANLAGTYLAGQSGRFIEKRRALSLIYFGRCFIFLGLLFLPITPAVVVVLSILLGLFWLSTVPLTSSLVATFFGTRWMSMLFGVVFLSHQVGSFAGLWLAGYLYDATKSYDAMWWICIALGLAAALVHWPIRERPVERLAARPA
ncbi:MAG TPA: MFS transporter [Hyphomicrobiaceae bacterium]|nr:MFS transporter [Hyphomicrobiaceae bacterium]